MRGPQMRLLLFVCAFLVVPSLGFSQSASLAGTVRDSSGSVLPGVIVEASSDALIEKTRTAVTDGTGQWRIIDLRPGTYTLTFSLTGFSRVVREGVEVEGSGVTTIGAEMRVGNLRRRSRSAPRHRWSTRRAWVARSCSKAITSRRCLPHVTTRRFCPPFRRSTSWRHQRPDDAGDGVVQRQRRQHQRGARTDRRHDGRRRIQWRRRVELHLQHERRRGNAGEHLRRPW